MNASELNQHFLSLADWVDPETTVDRVIIGDPRKEVRRVLVSWISSMRAVHQAIGGEFDALVTHEPTFWQHRNEHETMDATEIGRHKKQLIEQSGLVIVRNHDGWDRMPQIGIPWAWARFLGLGNAPVRTAAAGYQHRYDIEPLTLKEFAAEMANRTAVLGEPAVQVTGNLQQRVSRIGIGTGCACKIDVFREMDCDCSVVCDDGSCYWAGIQQAEDMDHPVIRVNHGTSEEPGMATMTQYINDNVLDVTAEHLPHGSTFTLIGGGLGE